MKKMLPLLLVGILVLSGFGAANIINDKSETVKKIETITFSEQLVIQEKDGYLTVKLEGADSLSTEAGKPMLPMYRKTFTFSSAAKIKEITCDCSEIKEKGITGKVIPAPEAVPRCYPDDVDREPLRNEDEKVYESNALFPGNWCDYTIRCGLNSRGVSTTFVIVEVHPVQYVPTENMLYYVSDAEIQVIYDDPGVDTTAAGLFEFYDMVIIAPEKFSESLQPLINHKNDHGVNTLLKTTEEIFDEYSGRDKPEQIKYFIKDAKETWNITYVLLVGGLKSYICAKDKDDCNQGSTAWHVPVRYTNIKHSYEIGVISDLYYSDLYRYNESSEEWEFEDWDSNGDGIFAKISFINSDTLDLVPDIYIGRLPCRTTMTLNIVVNKIITYEGTPPGEKPWFKRMIGIAGRTFDPDYEGQPDGEYVCDTAIGYMGDLITEPVRVYASNQDTGGLIPTADDIIQAVSEGAGYVNFEGHGNPWSWNTHNIGDGWAGGISLFSFHKFSNNEKLPVIIVGGCHNALFNVTLIKTLFSMHLNDDHWYWSHGKPTPVCFSWAMCITPKGGAIASTGCTGYGLGPAAPLANSAELEANFFYQIGQDGSTTLGSAHSGSISKYITENSIRKDQAFCIVEYQLFGDPSLKLGGYP